MKSAVVAVVGRTNAGKSTLVNRLVGEKVSIVSPVEQTTRNTVRGIVEEARGQLVLLDTPGLHKAVGELGRLLNRMARRSAAGADILCVMFDASVPPQLEDIGWMQRVAKEKPEKVVFVLNKADKPTFQPDAYKAAWDESLQFAVCSLQSADGDAANCSLQTSNFKLQTANSSLQTANSSLQTANSSLQTANCKLQTANCKLQTANCKLQTANFPVWVKSVSTEEGGECEVMDALFGLADEGERLFPEDIVSDYPRRLAIADVVREKFLRHLHQEVPHEMGICVKTIKESSGRWDVKAEILVNRASQKPIVIGRGAEVIKAARKAAERELRDVFDVKVALELWVRVEPNWMKNKRLLSEMGYLGAEL